MLEITMRTDGSLSAPIESAHARTGPAIKAVMGAILDAARTNAPVRTGALRSSIKTEAAGDRAALIAGAPHASFLHLGTGVYGPTGRPIEILPSTKRALWWPGARHPVRAVHQMGIRPRGFMRDALSDAFIRSAFDSAMNEEGER